MKPIKGKNVALGVVVTLMISLVSINAISISEPNRQLYDLAHSHTTDFEMPTLSINTVEGVDNVQLSSNQNDDEHPTVIKASDGSYIAAYDQQITPLEGHIYFMRSTDDGATWTEHFNTNTGDMASGLQKWPALLTLDDGSMVAVWDDAAYNYQYVMSTLNPGDPSSWEIYFLDQEGYDSERTNYELAAMSEITWGWCFIGHVEYAGYDLQRAIEAEFVLGAWDEATFSWTGDQFYPDSYNPDMAATPNYFWYIWDFPTDSGTQGLGLHWGEPNEEGDIALWPVEEFVGDYNYEDPSLAASGNNICMVYMTDDNIYGDLDLACRFSTDEGSTWQDGTFPSVAQQDEAHPDIFMSGSTVFCAYTRGGNLYLTKSTDLGQNWEEPQQINSQDGTVVSEPSSLKISEGGIVWTDTRNGNKDIYYAPLPTAILNVESISGGFGVSASVSNTGSVAGEQVSWSIDLSGLVFLGAETTGTIAILEPGDTDTISSGLVFGLGPSTITVTVGGASQAASGMVLGPLVLGL